MSGKRDDPLRLLEKEIDRLVAELDATRTRLQGLQNREGEETALLKEYQEQVTLLRKKVAETSRDLDSGYRRRRAEIRTRLADLLQRLERL